VGYWEGEKYVVYWCMLLLLSLIFFFLTLNFLVFFVSLLVFLVFILFHCYPSSLSAIPPVLLFTAHIYGLLYYQP